MKHPIGHPCTTNKSNGNAKNRQQEEVMAMERNKGNGKKLNGNVQKKQRGLAATWLPLGNPPQPPAVPSMQSSDTPSPYPFLSISMFLVSLALYKTWYQGPRPSKDHSVLLDGLSSKVCFSNTTTKLKQTLCDPQRHQILVVCLGEQ